MYLLSDSSAGNGLTLIDDLLGEQKSLTAVERFARVHDRHKLPALEKHYRNLLPATPPGPGQQYAFEVDLDKCSGCKSCVSACHSLNGLDEHETWRSVGLLISNTKSAIRNPKSERNPKPETRISELDIRSSFGSRASEFGFQQHVTTACHHCADPGCLNGCPVLAYDKDAVTGIVRHLDDQCIGCSYCIMKCPYEVPKYSDRLGIVRKCDMCSNRLAVGEAPACVQACPDEAIRITLVETSEVQALKRSSVEAGASSTLQPVNPSTHHGWLPDSPPPAITFPTTRYVSKRELPSDLVAADTEALRLDHAHWPLMVMLVLTQAAAGIFLAATVLAFSQGGPLKHLTLVGFGLLVMGLNAAILHLGQPLKAWRAFLGWRTSWLSREIILFNAFAGVATAALGSLWIPQLSGVVPMLMAAAAGAGLVGVFGSAMVYVDTGRRLWSRRIVFGNFFGSALVLGAAITAAILAWFGGPWLMTLDAAFLLHAALFLWRQVEIRAALQNRESRIHFAARVIRELLPSVQSGRTLLFLVSATLTGLALINAAGRAPLWTSMAAVVVLVAEIIARYVFFAAGAGKRMPGGVAA